MQIDRNYPGHTKMIKLANIILFIWMQQENESLSGTCSNNITKGFVWLFDLSNTMQMLLTCVAFIGT